MTYDVPPKEGLLMALKDNQDCRRMAVMNKDHERARRHLIEIQRIQKLLERHYTVRSTGDPSTFPDLDRPK